ncbi:MAG: M16 family metallopeptidase [Flavobacteriaceae bacterium]
MNFNYFTPKGILLLTMSYVSLLSAQTIAFEEYDLPNGLHVILHEDHTAPVVVTAVMYHVGSKDEDTSKTGFAHFFEHLMFEGTKNIERGEWFNIVSANGGQNNANTTQDRTYYFEVLPSNKLGLALWLESERMLHPVINQIGVDTQNEVVKEEKLQKENQPFGKLPNVISKHLYNKHPYRWTPIGKIEHLDAATLDDFKAFRDKFYVPNNAVLVVAGDFDPVKTKKMIADYFGPIPKGAPVKRVDIEEDPITETIVVEAKENPQGSPPGYVFSYRTPGKKTLHRDIYVLDLIAAHLGGSQTSKLHKKMVDQDQSAFMVNASHQVQEDYSLFYIMCIPQGSKPYEELKEQVDQEIADLQQNLISERELQKLLNRVSVGYIQLKGMSVSSIASFLAEAYTIGRDTNLVNTELDIYQSITREDIQRVAQTYLNSNQRLELQYLPK